MELTKEEIQMLANIIQRAGVNQIEVAWINSIVARLLAIAEEAAAAHTETISITE